VLLLQVNVQSAWQLAPASRKIDDPLRNLAGGPEPRKEQATSIRVDWPMLQLQPSFISDAKRKLTALYIFVFIAWQSCQIVGSGGEATAC